jgi:hypothetical protein
MTAELSLIEQLRAIAGVGSDTNRFSITTGAHVIDVLFAPGSSDSLTLCVPFPPPFPGPEAGARRPADHKGIALPLAAPRPLWISLKHESRTSMRAKEMGINREVEVGDAAFDERIYINSPSDDEIIKAVLAAPDLRAAVLELLERDASSIVIDDDSARVVVNVVEFKRRIPDQERGARMLAALTRIAAALPSVSPTPGGRRRDLGGKAMILCGILAFIGVLATPIAYHRLTPRHCIQRGSEGSHLICSAGPECCTPILTGLGVASLLSAILGIFLFYTVRGRSNSFNRMLASIIISTALLFEIGVIVARLAW